ncbi:MAG: peptidyl-prolyl cis-trans isomerase [candidate division Zixibacteria bacterium]|nr:peptidyl-prolyl cis-trans isomerase [candidate division Zixibacteria bacterium]
MAAILMVCGNEWLSAQPPLTSGPQAVLAIVNEDTITTAGMDSLLIQVHKQMNVEQRGDFDYRKLLDKMINDRVIIQEAKRLGMDQDSGMLVQLADMRHQDAIRQYVIDNFKPDLSVSEDSIRAHFETNYIMMQIRTVAVRGKDEAEKLIPAVREGASMDSIAKAVSVDTYRYRGGLHNANHLIDIDDQFRQQAARLKPGELSPAFPYKQAYSFLRLEQTIPADTAELSKYQGVIKSFFQMKKRDIAWRAFMEDMAVRYPAVIDSAVLTRIEVDSASLFTPTFVNSSPAAVLSVDDGHALTEGKLRSAISRSAMTSGDERFGRIIEKTLAAAKEELILGAAADAGGYEDNPEVTAKYALSRDSALIESYLKETVVPKIKFNRAEFETYYNEHQDDFRDPDQIKLDRIVTADSAAAFDAQRRLTEGANFYYLARQYNAQKDKEAAPEWAPLQSFPEEIKNDLERLEIGRSTRPYNTSDGWIIFHVADRRPGPVRPMANVEMKIREVMFQRKFNEEMDRVLAILKKGSLIVPNEAEIDRYFGSYK